jgi:hypothetical protein
MIHLLPETTYVLRVRPQSPLPGVGDPHSEPPNRWVLLDLPSQKSNIKYPLRRRQEWATAWCWSWIAKVSRESPAISGVQKKSAPR